MFVACTFHPKADTESPRLLAYGLRLKSEARLRQNTGRGAMGVPGSLDDPHIASRFGQKRREAEASPHLVVGGGPPIPWRTAPNIAAVSGARYEVFVISKASFQGLNTIFDYTHFSALAGQLHASQGNVVRSRYC